MKRYHELLQRRADLVAEQTAIFDGSAGRGLNDDEKRRDDELAAELVTLADEIAREDRRRANELLVAPVSNALAVSDTARISGGHDRALDRPWGQATGAPLGEFLQAVFRSANNQGTDPRLLYHGAAQGAGSAVGSDGGFLIGTTVVERVMLRIMTGEIMRRLQPIPLEAGTDSLEINVVDETSRVTGSRFGGVQGYWLDEGSAPSATRPRFGKMELKLRGLAALGYATNNLLRNATALQSVFERAFGEELRWLVESSVIRGTGAGQPLGLLNANALVTVDKETGQTAGTVVKENIDKMWSRLYAPARANAVWFINQDCEPQLDDLSMVIGTGGVPVYLPPGGLADTPFARLKGRPVIPIEYCSTVGTVGDIILANLDEYLFIEEAIQQASSLHVAFVTNEMAFRATYYVDGQLGWKSALTPANGSATLSPVVVLATRA